MTYAVRFTLEAATDLDRLYDFILQRDATDFTLAEAAVQAIRDGFATLRSSPFTCRKARSDAPFLRELVIPFGRSGYVALFEIEDNETVTVLAIRHQLEDDYH
ncbi:MULTISPECIES: type II toxin-antitoxin system RelE/ParE family toxin [unclassified Caballeronia]|uniref:type II toxin-antitoxin system RelE/ParE family toxin n=1 Tax=unclassified Caballeronia TaxID=2646786 RepID=UPI00285C2B62|nr:MULTISPECIES: type II toxin-antitoxin system RelE/ParE family toxin [unclassified Caballeronia]MDR5755051.1 type II toxin-antitoxin system RelE/ParE family toxin [Caballeronia sp. LZ024]MDR5845143.1 type II toxin-antitoxin system RelE/ParE family toxin [Caballeronia sp. LZ031]